MLPKSLPWPWSVILESEQEALAERPIGLSDEERSASNLIVGQPGTGKSKLVELLATYDVYRLATGASNRSVVVLDPHFDLTRNLLGRIALLAKAFPNIYDRIIWINPTNKRWCTGWNPVELMPGQIPEELAEQITETFTTLFHDDLSSVRMYRVMYHTFHTLSLAHLTLLDAVGFLTNRDFRERIVTSVNDPRLSNYWFKEFPKRSKDEREALEIAGSSLNRLERLTAHPGMKDLFGVAHSTFSIKDIVDGGKILIVSASKNLGEGSAYMLCAMTLAQLWAAVSRRMEDTPEEEREAIVVYCDEFTRYCVKTIPHIIEEGRKAKIEIFLATQQLKEHLSRQEGLFGAVINSVASIFSYRLGFADAELLSRNIFLPSLDQVKSRRTVWQKPFGINVPSEDITWRSIPEILEIETRRLTQIPNQHMYYHRRGQPGCILIKTRSLPDLKTIPQANELPNLLYKLEMAAHENAGKPTDGKTHSNSRKVLLLPPGPQINPSVDSDSELDYSQFFDSLP